jgi:hypothetical protein
MEGRFTAVQPDYGAASAAMIEKLKQKQEMAYTAGESGRLGGSETGLWIASSDPDALAVRSQLVGAPTLHCTFRSVQRWALSSQVLGYKSCYWKVITYINEDTGMIKCES